MRATLLLENAVLLSACTVANVTAAKKHAQQEKLFCTIMYTAAAM